MYYLLKLLVKYFLPYTYNFILLLCNRDRNQKVYGVYSQWSEVIRPYTLRYSTGAHRWCVLQCSDNGDETVLIGTHSCCARTVLLSSTFFPRPRSWCRGPVQETDLHWTANPCKRFWTVFVIPVLTQSRYTYTRSGNSDTDRSLNRHRRTVKKKIKIKKKHKIRIRKLSVSNFSATTQFISVFICFVWMFIKGSAIFFF